MNSNFPKALWVALAALVSACAATPEPEPVETVPASPATASAPVLIALLGFDDAIRARFGDVRGITPPTLTFAQPAQDTSCLPSAQAQASKSEMRFHFRSIERSAQGDVLMLTSDSAAMPAKGSYVLRDVSWQAVLGGPPSGRGEAPFMVADTAAHSLSFRYDGGWSFLGFYRFSLNDADEVVLQPAPSMPVPRSAINALHSGPHDIATTFIDANDCARQGLRRTGAGAKAP